jgi:Bacterial Ig-like domain (group 2)
MTSTLGFTRAVQRTDSLFGPMRVVAALIVLSACTDTAGPTTTPNPVPSKSIAVVGDSQVNMCFRTQLAVRGLDQRGQDLVARGVTWSSSDPKVASVSSAGSVAGVSPGWVTITATSGTETALAHFVVWDRVNLYFVRVLPTDSIVQVGATTQLHAIVDANDALFEPAVRWASLSPDRATVSATGVVTGLKAGGVNVVATYRDSLAGADPSLCPVREFSGSNVINVIAPAP